MQKIIEKILAYFAKKAIKKYKPMVIGITGSVGKSSAKEATFAVLSRYFNVRRSLKNYNNELGLPLTILGRLSPGKSIIGWLRVFWMAIGTVLFPEKSYPEILILEMGADHPGDIDYLLSVAPCKIGVVTAVSPSHLEFFKSLDNIVKDKQRVVSFLPAKGCAILNADDEKVIAMQSKTSAKVLTYGLYEGADIRALEINLEQSLENGKLNLQGLRFKVSYQGAIVPFFLPNIVAESQVYAALAAVAIGLASDLNLLEIAENLKSYQPLPGRMKPIKGIKSTLIIDDSYNSSPKAALSALENFIKIKSNEEAQTWAVLGDMLELGETSREEHLAVGRLVVALGIDHLIAVGEEAKAIIEAAKRKGMDKEKIKHFEDAQSAGEYLKQNIKENDLILVKGSRAIELEVVVKKIMLSPQHADRLLIGH